MMRRIKAVVAIATVTAGVVAAQAADESVWDRDLRSAVRLVAASPKQGVLRAAVEIRLDPGWKTYWRYPGDSGVPTDLDFSKSGNVKSLVVLWPAPARFPDGAGGHSIGYRGSVTLPVHVVPADPRQPVMLRLKAHYGVCEKLCVPAQAATELPLKPVSGAHDEAVTTAEARVPRVMTLGAPGALSMRSVKRNAEGKGHVIVDVAAPAGASVDLFAEGPSAHWALPLPKPVEASGDVRRFTFELDGLPPGEKPAGAMLRFTAVSADSAIETSFRLD